MNKNLIDKISTIFNRSVQQTNFLFELLGHDYGKLIDLELKIKNNFIHYCPGDLDDVEEIMSLNNKTDYFKIELFPQGTIKIRIDENNKNCLVLKQKQNDNTITVWKAIPPGKNRLDIITNSDIDACYLYDADVILIQSGEETRKIFHLNILQLEYNIKSGSIVYENKYEHIKRI